MVFPQMIHLFYIFIEQEQVCVESVKTDEFIMAIVHFMIQHFLSKCDEIEFPSCVPTGINITIYLLQQKKILQYLFLMESFVSFLMA